MEDGRIYKETMMRKRLERFDEIEIVDETNRFGMDFFEQTESKFRTFTPDMEAVL